MMKPSEWIVLFDAVGTLIRPQPDVVSIYLETSRQYGSRLEAGEIRNRFQQARQTFFDSNVPVCQLKPGSLTSSDAIEQEKWKQLVQYVLHDVKPIDLAFNSLWNHFAAASNWQVYPDVVSCWQQLTEMGITIGIASNFDARLKTIANELPQLQSCQHVFCSGSLGFLKPDPEFFRRIAAQFAEQGSRKFAMVGDNRRNDYEAPKQMGWKAVWLQRQAKFPTQSSESVAGLTEIPQLLSTQ